MRLMLEHWESWRQKPTVDARKEDLQDSIRNRAMSHLSLSLSLSVTRV
jgi:hypothetical protein